jgi:hypothetical protein
MENKIFSTRKSQSNLIRVLVGTAVLANTLVVARPNFYLNDEPQFKQQGFNYFFSCALPSALIAGVSRYLDKRKPNPYLNNLREEIGC